MKLFIILCVPCSATSPSHRVGGMLPGNSRGSSRTLSSCLRLCSIISCFASNVGKFPGDRPVYQHMHIIYHNNILLSQNGICYSLDIISYCTLIHTLYYTLCCSQFLC